MLRLYYYFIISFSIQNLKLDLVKIIFIQYDHIKSKRKLTPRN